MQSIGERLEEARKRKGISIHEASEATKIRGEFLLAFEDNSLEIPLPEVYVRGFLTNYAKFLKLDKNTLLADYDALQLGRGKDVKKENHDYLGRMDLPEKEAPESLEVSEPIASPPPVASTTSTESSASPLDKVLYYKVGLVFGGAFLVIILLVLLVYLIASSRAPEVNPDLAAEAVSSLEASGDLYPPVTASALEEEEIILVARDDVTVIVTQMIDDQELYKGTLTKGENYPLKKVGRIRLRYTEGDSLIVKKGNQTFEMSKSGVGANILD